MSPDALALVERTDAIADRWAQLRARLGDAFLGVLPDEPHAQFEALRAGATTEPWGDWTLAWSEDPGVVR